MGVVGCEERAEKDDDGRRVEKSGLNEDADDAGQPVAPTNACDILGGDTLVDLQNAVYDQACTVFSTP